MTDKAKKIALVVVVVAVAAVVAYFVFFSTPQTPEEAAAAAAAAGGAAGATGTGSAAAAGAKAAQGGASTPTTNASVANTSTGVNASVVDTDNSGVVDIIFSREGTAPTFKASRQYAFPSVGIVDVVTYGDTNLPTPLDKWDKPNKGLFYAYQYNGLQYTTNTETFKNLTSLLQKGGINRLN